MKTIKLFSGLLGLVLLSVACSKSSEAPEPGNEGGETGNENTEYVAPAPPETIVEENLLKIAFFSTLSDQTLFASQEPSVLNSLINNSSSSSILYFLERSDVRLGEPIPQVEIGLATRSFSFFAQIEPTSEQQVKGTGIVTRVSVEQFDAVWEGSLKMSGCTFSAPLAKTAQVTLYTSRFDSQEQIETLVAQRSSVLQTSGIVVASIRNDIKTQVSDWLKYNLKNYRIEFAKNESSEYDLMVLTPVGYVCREMDRRTEATLPYFNLSIEKL